MAQDASIKTHRRHPGCTVGILFFKSIFHCGITIAAPDASGYFDMIEGYADGSRNGGLFGFCSGTFGLAHANPISNIFGPIIF